MCLVILNAYSFNVVFQNDIYSSYCSFNLLYECFLSIIWLKRNIWLVLQIQCLSGIFLESFALGRFTWLLSLMSMVEQWGYERFLKSGPNLVGTTLANHFFFWDETGSDPWRCSWGNCWWNLRRKWLKSNACCGVLWLLNNILSDMHITDS